MKNLFKALFDFQQEVPTIYKTVKNEFANYHYADLATVIETITPILKKHGLGFVQPIVGNEIKTIVFHVESGETIESMISIDAAGVQLKGMNQFQVEGSAITYKRRYAISSILGLVTDKDTDAAGEQVKSQTIQAKKPAFDLNELSTARNAIQKYASDGNTYDEIEKKILAKYSGIAANVKTEIKKIVDAVIA